MSDIPQLVAAIDSRLADIAAEIAALDAAKAELAAPRTDGRTRANTTDATATRARRRATRRRLTPSRKTFGAGDPKQRTRASQSGAGRREYRGPEALDEKAGGNSDPAAPRRWRGWGRDA
jgi:hypothetical protein